MAEIKLNFLPIEQRDFSFRVYRKLRTDTVVNDDTLYTYSLPTDKNASRDRTGYLISFHQREGFEPYDVFFLESRDLTKKLLTVKLIDQLRKSSSLPFNLAESKYNGDRIEFTLDELSHGRRVIFLMPYFLESKGKYGFLVDYKFIKNADVPFDKEVQKLSLSLDKAGNSNKNYYTDKYRLLQSFLRSAYNDFQSFPITDDLEITVSHALCAMQCMQLGKKEYMFHHSSTSYSQFQGIRNYGPYKRVSASTQFIFIFEDKYRSFANDLYLSLVGKLNPGTFPGLEIMFKLDFGLDSVKRIQLEDYSKQALLKAVEKVKDFKRQSPETKFIGIYIEDYSSEDKDETASENYYFLKYHFIKENIALQVVNYRKLGAKNALKWSTSNLALQIFSKLGGIPWLVKPNNSNCLILGIGSSHKRDPKTKKTTKYFAYTVCLDSSGLYKSLDILAEAVEEESYLEQLKKNLVILLQSGKFDSYKTCVLHLPFKIKRSEIKALTQAVEQVKQMNFVAIKINLDNKFFGYSSHNTLVPYESSYVQLSKREFLIWFEGLLYGKEVVDKRLSNPVHLEFLNLTDNSEPNSRDYLQDVLNLSGANWRGFNSRSVPISIYYSKIITEYTKAFEELEEYNEGAISNDRPWFL
ncbi:hypothetical protein H7F15_18350 [Pontibacter sp. Tf4]|uniref:Piwi domain-containing protein n=1 Tax=Pontibacter sp. Tf4 TaxID=2761620 RepID=UPI001628050C|nr:Piwi domain-containing protein [Pontibacter sp. Tf4]MBB6613008.1 hypothetical protein [Pontibacter sp. Tf4]